MPITAPLFYAAFDAPIIIALLRPTPRHLHHRLIIRNDLPSYREPAGSMPPLAAAEQNDTAPYLLFTTPIAFTPPDRAVTLPLASPPFYGAILRRSVAHRAMISAERLLADDTAMLFAITILSHY